jgi:hypothetical protein
MIILSFGLKVIFRAMDDPVVCDFKYAEESGDGLRSEAGHYPPRTGLFVI